MAGQDPTAKHPMAKHAMAGPKSKMRSLGHGVYVDSKGMYHSKDGKFMSKAAADKALGKGPKSKSGPARDAHGRFVKNSKVTKSTRSTMSSKTMKASKPKTSLVSKIKAKLHGKPKPTTTKPKPKS